MFLLSPAPTLSLTHHHEVRRTGEGDQMETPKCLSPGQRSQSYLILVLLTLLAHGDKRGLVQEFGHVNEETSSSLRIENRSRREHTHQRMVKR